MVGRKAPKTGKAKLKVAPELVTKKLKKLKKAAPANAVDLSKLTSVKKLNIEDRSKDVNLLTSRLNTEDILCEKIDGRPSKLQMILISIKDGLPRRRIEGLRDLAQYLQVCKPEVLKSEGPNILGDLTGRLIDDEEIVRNMTIELIDNYLVKGLPNLDDKRRFCLKLRASFWKQLTRMLTDLKVDKKLTGLVYLSKLLTSCPAITFQDETFVQRILPSFLELKEFALKPGKSKTKSVSGSSKFDSLLEPVCGKWAPMYAMALQRILCHLTNPEFTRAASVTVQKSFDSLFNDFAKIDFLATAPVSTKPSSVPKTAFNNEGSLKRASICDSILYMCVGWVRMLLGQIDQSVSKKSATAVAPKIVLLSLSLLHWIVAVAQLHDRTQGRAHNARPSSLDLTQGTISLGKAIFSNEQGAVQQILAYENGGVVALFEQIATLLPTMHRACGHKQTEAVKVELAIACAVLGSSEGLPSKDARNFGVRLRRLLCRIHDIPSGEEKCGADIYSGIQREDAASTDADTGRSITARANKNMWAMLDSEEEDNSHLGVHQGSHVQGLDVDDRETSGSDSELEEILELPPVNSASASESDVELSSAVDQAEGVNGIMERELTILEEDTKVMESMIEDTLTLPCPREMSARVCKLVFSVGEWSEEYTEGDRDRDMRWSKSLLTHCVAD